jgi:RNA polymerase sigma factor (sigma-70 family)
LQKDDWQSIVPQYANLVWQTCYRLVKNHADACDCFQDTFLCAFEMSNHHHIRNMPGLLACIATRRSLDALRSRYGKKQVYEGSEHIEALEAPNPGPSMQAQANELVERLQKALTQIGPEQAESFCMRYLSDMSQKEIAKELGIKKSAAGVLVHRARLKLQQKLGSNSNGEEP